MPQQTSVSAPAVGQAGTFATTADRGITDRKAAEAIPVGKFVVLTAGDETSCELPDAATEITDGLRTLGFALLDDRRGDGVTESTNDYTTDSRVRIAEKGEVYVTVEDAVTAGNAVFVRHAGSGLGLGSCRSDADTANAAALPNAVYKTSAGANGLAIVKFYR